MEAPTMLYVASGFFGLLAMTGFVRWRDFFKRSQPRIFDGHDRAAIRERNWYRKTEKERISAQKALN